MIARFVTATGTAIGKTFVTAALVHQARGQGLRVRALKPVVTGWGDGALSESDPGVLIASLGERFGHGSLDAVAPFRFAAPLAPTMAARREGRELDYGAMLAFCERAAREAPDRLIIEGVGGVMVPLAGRLTVLDWMAALGHPAILVAGSYLGTLSHTLTALGALAQRGVPLAGLVVSESEGSTVDLAETVAALRDFVPDRPIIAQPRLTGPQAWMRASDLSALWAPGE